MFSLVNWGCSAVTAPANYLNIAANDDVLTVRVLCEAVEDTTNFFINSERDLYDVNTYLINNTCYSSNETVFFSYKDKTLKLLYESSISKKRDLEFDWRLNEKIYFFMPKSDVEDLRYLGNMIAMNVTPFTHFYSRKLRTINKLFIILFPHLVGFIRMYPIQGYESMRTAPKLIKVNSPDRFISDLPDLKFEQVNDSAHPFNDEFQSATTITYDFEGPQTIKSGESVEITVKSHFVNGNPYPVDWDYTINPLSGYVPNRVVSLKQGQGSFTVTALGLKAGDKVNMDFMDGLIKRGHYEIPVV